MNAAGGRHHVLAMSCAFFSAYVIAPAIFLFVFLIFLGTLLEEGLDALIGKLLVLAFLFGAHLLFRARGVPLGRAALLSIYAGILIIVCASGITLGVEPARSILFPIALITSLFSMLPYSWKESVMLLSISALALGVNLSLFPWTEFAGLSYAVALYLGAMLLLLALPLLRTFSRGLGEIPAPAAHSEIATQSEAPAQAGRVTELLDRQFAADIRVSALGFLIPPLAALLLSGFLESGAAQEQQLLFGIFLGMQASLALCHFLLPKHTPIWPLAVLTAWTALAPALLISQRTMEATELVLYALLMLAVLSVQPWRTSLAALVALPVVLLPFKPLPISGEMRGSVMVLLLLAAIVALRSVARARQHFTLQALARMQSSGPPGSGWNLLDLAQVIAWCGEAEAVILVDKDTTLRIAEGEAEPVRELSGVLEAIAPRKVFEEQGQGVIFVAPHSELERSKSHHLFGAASGWLALIQLPGRSGSRQIAAIRLPTLYRLLWGGEGRRFIEDIYALMVVRSVDAGGARAVEREGLLLGAVDELTHLLNNRVQQLVLSGSGEGAHGAQAAAQLHEISTGITDISILLRAGTRGPGESSPVLSCDLQKFCDELRRGSGARLNISEAISSNVHCTVRITDDFFPLLRALLRMQREYGGQHESFTGELAIKGELLSLEILGIDCSAKHNTQVLRLGPASNDARSLIRAIAAQVEACRGRIFVDDGQYGQASRIEVQLPITGERTVKAPRVETGWVLLVEDAREALQLYQRVAGAIGLESCSAVSREQVREILRGRGRPALAITDHLLGGCDANSIIEEIRINCGDDVPVLVITGSSRAREVVGVGRRNIKVLLKPLSMRALVAELESTLGRR